MGKIERDNILSLLINDEDPLLARLEYILWALDEYEGVYVRKCEHKIEEAIFWYKKSFDLE